jgi:dihydrofolate reductase
MATTLPARRTADKWNCGWRRRAGRRMIEESPTKECVMARLVVTVASTLDGFAAGPGGDVFSMPLDLGFDRYNRERMRQAGALLFGATSFAGARAYWPALADDASAPPEEQEIARLHAELPKVVVSDRLGPAETAPWALSTTVVRRADAPEHLARLKETTDGDIACFGSLTTWNALLPHGLVDEIHVLLGPAALGDGVPTFRQPLRGLTPVDVRRLDDSGLVAVRYAVDGSRPA